MNFFKAVMLSMSCVVLTGCSALNFTVDGLLNAPKLSDEQSEIHEALIASVGSNITLKYPKNGDNRSAYVIADIDDEPTDEALVFYEYTSSTSEQGGLRVNVLDKRDNGSWYSVKELAGAGTDVDQVIITTMSDSDKTDVIVGYQNVTGDDKTLEVYSYEKGSFKRIGMDTYSILDTLDVNGDGHNEIITVQRTANSDTGAVTAKAHMLNIKNGKLVRDESADMCSNVKSYVSSMVGKTSNGDKAIYIDGVNAEGKLQTEMIYCKYSKLQNPMQLQSKKLLTAVTRPDGYYCGDIDGDGVVEIPTVKPMLGYEKAGEDAMLNMTTWSVYKDFYQIKNEYSGYYAISDGYFFTFPTRWNDSVTVKKDTDSGEYVFCKYTGNIETSTTEIMRIAVSSKNDSSHYVSDGYQLIDSKGQLDYFVKLPSDRRENLILTIDEVQNNFYIVS